MNIHDLKIGTRLALGLGCIIAFVILLGIVSYTQEESLWQETKGLYEHPLQVRRAIGELEVDILTMHRGMKDLVLTDNESERQQIISSLDTADVNAEQMFDILNERYLGPKSDIDTAYSHFIEWRSNRAETIRLQREGDDAQAIDRTKTSGAGGTLVTRIMSDLDVISDFSMNRGDLFYQSAEGHKNTLILQLGVLLLIILLLSLGISYFLMRGIRDPVKELTFAADQYRKGRLDVRSRYTSANEFGMLSASFNSHIETIQHEMESRENAAHISAVMLREESLRSFCQELLKGLIEHTDSQIGAIYLLNSEKTEFSLFESIGLCTSCRSSFSALIQEGEFGLALATGKIQRVTDIPDNSFVLTTVTGDIRPGEIITIPIQGGKEIVAMISLSCVRPYSPQAIRLVHDTYDILTARFNGVLAFEKIREFLQTLENQNRELSAQSRELVSQTHELKEQNTELEVQKKQLDEANRLKSVFLSNMSHELRTPLNSVIALSGVLSRRLEGSIPEDEFSYLEVIERNGRLLLSLINDILDIARIEAGREDVQISRFSVQDLVSTVLEMVQPQAEEKNITLNNHVDSSIPPITSDLSKCQHILQNLIANAVKFTGKGMVTISASVTGKTLRITVADTGIGISDEMIPYIFDEFRQADERIGRMYGGSGLGLSIAKKYALLLDGDVTVQSTLGSGSTFTLRLPLMPPGEFAHQQVIEPGDPLHHSGAVSSFRSSGEPKTILLVEDNEPAIIQIRDLLEEQGYHVRVAKDGKEALQQVHIALPDAMILDLMMPEVDGFTVLHMIRSQETTALLPVLILTAKHISKEELNFLKGNHVHQLIQKGDISRSGLLAAVKNMVHVQEKQNEPVRETTPPRTLPEHPTVLIVEDNPDSMLTVRALLKDRYTLIEATDGRSGLHLARTHSPDLILLDISLPVTDGFEVLETLRKDECLHDIPIIALTARAMKGDREEMLSRGFDGYLSKPVDSELLEQTIQRVLHGK